MKKKRSRTTRRVADANPAAAGGELVNRSEAARMLGVSETTLRRMEESHQITPIMSPTGVHQFRKEELRQVDTRRARADAPRPEEYDGPTAAAVFKLLNAHVSPVAIVEQTQLHPHAVRAIHAEWSRLEGGGLFLSDEDLRELFTLPYGIRPGQLGSGTEFITVLRNMAQGVLQPCQDCATQAARFCSACATRRHARQSQGREPPPTPAR